jgi:hypothetical protein
VAVAAIWLAAVSSLVLWWPTRDVPVAIAVVHATANAIGSATWLARPGGWTWLLAIAYLAIVAELSSWCWRRLRSFPG